MIARISRSSGTVSLASYINTALTMCRLIDHAGHQCYVDFSAQPMRNYCDEHQEETNQWNWFFEQPFALPEISEGKNPLHRAPLWVYEEDDWRAHCGDRESIDRFERLQNVPPRSEDALDFLRQMALRYLTIKPFVHARAALIFEKHGLTPERTIVVSHRGMNRWNDVPLIAVSDYFPVLEKLIMQNPGTSLWVTADEQHNETLIRDRFPQAVVMPEFWSSPKPHSVRMDDADCIDPQPGYDKALKTITLILMRSMCGHIVGNWSNSLDLSMAISNGNCVRL